MDSVNGYAKVDTDDEEARRRTRKRIIIVIISSIILAAAIVVVRVGMRVHKRNHEPTRLPSSQMSPASSIKVVCSQTLYPESCISSLSALDTNSNTTDPKELFKLSLRVVMNSLQNVSLLTESHKNKTSDKGLKVALDICVYVIEDAIDDLTDSISFMDASSGEVLTALNIFELKTWLSSIIANQETCLDAIREMKRRIPEDLNKVMQNSSEYAINSLSIVARILGALYDFDIPVHRKLSGFPDWVGAGDRRLLEEANPNPNVTVAADGSGDCLTVMEAVARIPMQSPTRFVIYVKAGEYFGNVFVNKSLWNVMMYGDGKDKTILSGNLYYKESMLSTFQTPTFAVEGYRFMAKDITFKNTAGAAKYQAVAMRSSGNYSVFYRCSFEGYQDTLYTHMRPQFYRDCDITGTVDFIFGFGAAIFQNCRIMPRQPLPGQYVTITASGKKSPEETAGIIFHKCSIFPLDKLTAATYLGRPWSDYSTTVIMQTEIGAFLSPSGWIEWEKNVTPPSTIFYAEYENTGPGSTIDKRVTWPGFRPSITHEQANKFSVASFIYGDLWLPATNVPYQSFL